MKNSGGRGGGGGGGGRGGGKPKPAVKVTDADGWETKGGSSKSRRNQPQDVRKEQAKPAPAASYKPLTLKPPTKKEAPPPPKANAFSALVNSDDEEQDDEEADDEEAEAEVEADAEADAEEKAPEEVQLLSVLTRCCKFQGDSGAAASTGDREEVCLCSNYSSVAEQIEEKFVSVLREFLNSCDKTEVRLMGMVAVSNSL